MATLPKATTSVEATAGAPGGGTDIVCILAASASNPDAMPRLFGSADNAHAMHGYSLGIEYASLHTEETGKPFIYVALPIATAGTIGRVDKSGNSGSSVVTLTAGDDGVLAEHDGAIRVKKGGTVGTDQIVLEYSLDDQISWKSYRLGTDDEFTISHVDVDVALGAGTLVAGDVIVTWHGTDPLPDADGLQAAFENLAGQPKLFRSVMLIGDLANDTAAQAFLDKLNAYETSHERFVYGRASIKDRLPFAQLSDDALTITVADAGSTGTFTREAGSWIADGFRVGDSITSVGFVASTGANNVTATITVLTASVMTVNNGSLVSETIEADASGVNITAGQTKAAWMAASDAEFGAIDGPTARRLDLGAGRGRKLSPFSGWNLRFPVAFAASVREYQHDLHIPTWRKQDGNTGYNLFDSDNNLVEWDDRKDGSAGSAARFTTFRTYGNGPGGAYVTLSLTRDADGSILSYTHNMAVTNLVCTIVQAMTENFIGRTPVLNDDGTATEDELKTLETEVNAELERVILTSRGEGPRASLCVWRASRDDVLNVPEALLTGVVDLNLNGTIHSVDTRVRVRSGGQ